MNATERLIEALASLADQLDTTGGDFGALSVTTVKRCHCGSVYIGGGGVCDDCKRWQLGEHWEDV